jgi:hypothetical protein
VFIITGMIRYSIFAWLPYLCESFPTCLDPYPGGPQGAFTRFFPQGIGLPRSCSGSALHTILDSHFSPGGLFGAAAISSCSGPPVCLPPRWLPPPRPFQASGSRGFYFWAPHSSLPPRGPDMLAVRIEQLTAGRLALPKIRSLVGCTSRPDPESLTPPYIYFFSSSVRTVGQSEG